MYVCICKQVTDSQIQQAIENGADCISKIQQSLGASSECGSCIDCITDMIEEFIIPANTIKVINSATLPASSPLAAQLS